MACCGVYKVCGWLYLILVVGTRVFRIKCTADKETHVRYWLYWAISPIVVEGRRDGYNEHSFRQTFAYCCRHVQDKYSTLHFRSDWRLPRDKKKIGDGYLLSAASLSWLPCQTPAVTGPAVGLFVGWLVLTSHQHDGASQGRICLDKCTCCHTEIEVANQTFYLNHSQYRHRASQSQRWPYNARHLAG